MRKAVSFLLFAAALVIALSACENKNEKGKTMQLNEGWKFITGDNLAYAVPGFDDTDWKDIEVNKTWNKQGYDNYEGFAWYRIRVVIPSTLREKAAMQDSLVFNLGKIDDFDQVFLNGELIGENLRNVEPGSEVRDSYKDLNYSFWDKQRRYSLPADNSLIRWDEENVIAIRVFDWGVAGGIFAGDLSIRMQEIGDYLALNINSGRFESSETQLGKTVTLVNTSSRYTVNGTLEIEVQDNITEKVVYKTETSISLSPNEEMEYAFNIDKPLQSTTITYRVRFNDSSNGMELREGAPYILTPPTQAEPQINGALIYGERPGKPFLYRIAVTGMRPLKFSAVGLPAGLNLDCESGIITGSVAVERKYEVNLTASNEYGTDTKTVEFVIGDQLALTPPMGWNSWNCWGLSVTQERVYAAAKSFVDNGLADHGWTYINIDDGWEIFGDSDDPKRSPVGEILTNEKFPDMKKLGDDIHALGLKFGIYSSPGELTCGGYTGSYQHEYQDAATFAKWGIDYLKYDLCSYRNIMRDQYSAEELMPPYQLMNEALSSIDRDIVYSICEYGNGKVWEWGESVGGNLWRTTGDIWDDWDRMCQIGFGRAEAAGYGGPGHWNDPDMLVLGWVGWGPNLHQTELTPDEQYTHVSLWALLAAPLLLGNDLTRLDDFTMNLITNDEVIAIDQDKLGQQAIPVIRTDNIEVWQKKLADGNIALGIFNVSESRQVYELDLSLLGLTEAITLRDVWRQQDYGEYEKSFQVAVPSHGVVLLKTDK